MQSLKGVVVGVLCPVFAVYASGRPVAGLHFEAYCGDPHEIGWEVLVVVVVVDDDDVEVW